MKSLTWKEVWQRRLARHYLLEPAPAKRIVDVAGAICGVHAQIMQAAELSLGARVEGITRTAVQDDLWHRRWLVKAYALRGTVHLLPAHELSLWMAALRADPFWLEPSRLSYYGMERGQAGEALDAIGDALDGRLLTREELFAEVARRVGQWATEGVAVAFGGNVFPPVAYLLVPAALTGRLCFGPNQGNRVTFVRPDQWVGPLEEIESEQALREVFRRYLTAYGPATSRDFAQWLHTEPDAAERVFDSLASEVEEVDVEGHHAWLLASDVDAPWEPAHDSVRLLPHFDAYGIGCHPRDRLVPRGFAGRALDRGAIGPVPLLLVDGVVGGTWKRNRRGKRIEVEVEPFSPLTRPQMTQLQAEADRVARFLGAEAILTIVAPS